MDYSGKRIAIFVSFSGQGGVERVVNLLSRGFLERGVKVDLLAPRITGDHMEQIPPGVSVVRLKTQHTYSALWRLARYMRREKPDAVLAVKHRAIVTAVLAGIISGFKGRIVGNIHTTISAGLAYNNFIKRFTYLGEMRLFYRLAHAIVGVSRGVADDIKNITRLDGEKVKTIYNPVITPEIFVQGKQPLDHPWFSNEPIPVILGIGRLTKQKDFHTLINAFTEVHKTRACRLVILGDGADLDSLRSLTREKGIQDDVDFAGFQANPYAYLSRASLFVLSSRWEGFGMVLVEAMAFGTPVVSTDCPNGPREILKDGQYGHLVPVEDPPALAKAMIKTLDDPLAFEKLESKAQDFTAGRAARQYLQTLII